MFFLSNVYECSYCGSDTVGPGVIAGTVILLVLSNVLCVSPWTNCPPF